MGLALQDGNGATERLLSLLTDMLDWRPTLAHHGASAQTEIADMPQSCPHLDQLVAIDPRTPQGCEECLKTGSWWVHLRLCLSCGHVGCCDQSPNRHATAHFHETQHPVMRSFQPGEDWGWCYVDEIFFEPAPGAR